MEKLISCKLKNTGGGWYEIAKVGRWQGHRAGEFELNESDLNQILFNFKNLGLDVVVDYEHQTLNGAEAPASGWIKHPSSLKVENNTLFAKIEWTKRAKEQIKNKEYRYLSPVLIQNAVNPKTGNHIGWYLHSVALTNTPFFNELSPISAKQTNTERKTMDKTEELQEKINSLQKQLDELQKENNSLKTVVAKQKVQEAISAKKLTKDQEEWALNYALKDEKGFEEFISKAKPLVVPPESNQFEASNKPEDIDVVKLALGGDDV